MGTVVLEQTEHKGQSFLPDDRTKPQVVSDVRVTSSILPVLRLVRASKAACVQNDPCAQSSQIVCVVFLSF